MLNPWQGNVAGNTHILSVMTHGFFPGNREKFVNCQDLGYNCKWQQIKNM